MQTRITKILCLDVGDARIGLAVSDGLLMMAHPLEVIARSKGQPLEKIASLARHHHADLILVGLPLNMDGTEGPQARKTRRFADGLHEELPDVEMAMWDERLSTRQSRNLRIESGAGRKRRAEPVDALSAAVILQSYLDHLRLRAVPPTPPDATGAGTP